MSVTLDFDTPENRISAAQFVAQLVREGVVFKVVKNGDTLEVSFSGGF